MKNVGNILWASQPQPPGQFAMPAMRICPCYTLSVLNLFSSCACLHLCYSFPLHNRLNTFFCVQVYACLCLWANIFGVRVLLTVLKPSQRSWACQDFHINTSVLPCRVSQRDSNTLMFSLANRLRGTKCVCETWCNPSLLYVKRYDPLQCIAAELAYALP